MTRTLFAAALFAAVASAQSMQTMTASIRGGGGDRGKCTIEVNVDGVAEVEIRGNQGRLRTLEGQPATWRRFECNIAPPRNPANFRFKGIDGRGRQTLLRDPSSTGVAVVRLEDPQGGREGYTFDIEWDGASGYGNSPWDGRGTNPNNRPGYNNDRGYGNDRGYNNDRGYGNRPDDRGYGNNSSRFDMNRSVRLCQDAVSAKARREFRVRNTDFKATNADDLRGNRDRISGAFEANRGEWYEYSCTVNSANGDIRNVDIRRRR